MRNEIDSLQNDGIKYDEHHFRTLTFNKLGKTARDFLADVKRQTSAFNTSTFIADTRYGILVLFVERFIFRTAEKHGILVLDLEHSNYLPHTRGMLV